jgi:hypothetical protein
MSVEGSGTAAVPPRLALATAEPPRLAAPLDDAPDAKEPEAPDAPSPNEPLGVSELAKASPLD